ncbi:MAG TPA: hypothetical protein VG406_20610, partial [Isosphaeraceae bacterium]|nr:hypothetical protein [Isosphaeraceae bacterium]
ARLEPAESRALAAIGEAFRLVEQGGADAAVRARVDEADRLWSEGRRAHARRLEDLRGRRILKAAGDAGPATRPRS